MQGRSDCIWNGSSILGTYVEYCKEVLLGFPFTIHRQQMDSSSVVLISTHSSANTERYGLDFKLSISFLSSQLLMASKSITAENVDVYWAFYGPSLTCCWRNSSDQGIEFGCKGQAIFGKKIYRSQKLSILFFEWLCSLSYSVAWFQSWIPRVVHAPLAVEGAFPCFWQSLQNMPCLGSSQYTQGYFCSHSFL